MTAWRVCWDVNLFAAGRSGAEKGKTIGNENIVRVFFEAKDRKFVRERTRTNDRGVEVRLTPRYMVVQRFRCQDSLKNPICDTRTVMGDSSRDNL